MKSLLLFLLILGAVSNVITLTSNTDLQDLMNKENWMNILYGIWLALQIVGIILIFKNL
jgi:hypothetical protein